VAVRTATRFALGKIPPAPARYDQGNEAAFRRALSSALEGVFVATNTASLNTAGSTLRGWSHDLTFSASDNDTVAWGSGSIYLPNGTTYSIDAGNTGNMATVTYVFLDTAVSETVLQITTTASSAVGTNRILVCVAQDVASGKDAQFQVFGGADASELVLLTADVIAADTITANEIAANTITGAEVLTMDLTTKTLTADTGTIGGWSMTASTLSSSNVTLASGANPYLAVGSAMAYATGTGFWAGFDSGTAKFRVGSTTAYARWTGTDFQILGASVASPATGSAYTLLGWAQTCVFSAVDADTVAWAAGDLDFSQGESYSISGSNTGNMTAGTTYYVYWDNGATTQYNVSTTYTDAVGHGKVLVAICRPASDGTEAVFQVLGGTSGEFVFITADQIAANTITANEIAANTITATEVNITTLSAITADMGSLTAGSIVIGTTNKIWLNDSSDGALNIGGSTKASAPFRVTAAGALTATNATITGTIAATTVIATDNFTATNPVFDGSVDVEAGQGGVRLSMNASSGAGRIQFFNSSGDQRGYMVATTNDFNIFANNADLLLQGNTDVTVTASGGDITLNHPSGDIILPDLPTSDPGVTGALWNNSGVVEVS
jgi:hypothetical protein